MKTPVTITILFGVAALAGGCATKKFVRQQVDPVSGKLDQVSTKSDQQGQTLDQTRTSLDQTKQSLDQTRSTIEKDETALSATNVSAASGMISRHFERSGLLMSMATTRPRGASRSE